MKITLLETILIKEFPNLLYVRIHTDEGIIGLGETYFGARAVETWIHETASFTLIGANPLQIEKIWNILNGFLGFNSTGVENRWRSAIDMALWDIMGKCVGMPLYQLLGGQSREKVLVYNTCAGYRYVRQQPRHASLPSDNWGIGTSEGPYEDLTGFLYHADELAQNLLEEGFTGMKIWPFDVYAEKTSGQYIAIEDLKKALEPFEKIRRAVGDRMRIMVEFHSLWTLPAAKEIAHALEQYEPTWYEDPIKMDNLDALKSFHDATRVMTTASETLGTRWSFRDALVKDAMDIVMFDPSWVGGVSESKRIATLAESFQKPIAPHDCTGPVEFSVAVHLSINASNTYIQEAVRAFFTGWYQELVTEVPRVVNGYVYPLEGPGIGTELRPEIFQRKDVVIQTTKTAP